ncbi:MAG TPA: gamma-glutamyl-gamma-aminobutyrate hydrolase family protein [Acidobacteriaceae bacterium]
MSSKPGDKPRIAIPLPTSTDPEYNQRSWPQYARAVEQSGGTPVEVPLHQDPSAIARQVASCAGVLLPGSPADIFPQRYGQQPHPRTSARDPLREAADELLLQDAFNLHKPLLCICYGHQSMNVWKGGTLVQHLETPVNHTPGRTVAEAHPVTLTPHARHLQAAFAGQSPQVNSSHHQAVATPGDGLFPAAYVAQDNVVEAVEAEEGFVVGLQWHPERTFDTQPASRRIFADFIDAARAWSVPAIDTEPATPPGSHVEQP